MTHDVQILSVLDKVQGVARDGWELMNMAISANVAVEVLDTEDSNFDARLKDAKACLEPYKDAGSTPELRTRIARLVDTLALAESLCGEVKVFVGQLKDS